MAYKHDYDKALTRLVSILTKLYNGEDLSVKELAEEFNVSTRTIQRDFNERLASFPIYQENRKWKMQEGFKLEKTTSIENQVVLDIMEKLVDGVGSKFSSKAKALLSKIKNDDYNPIYAKLDMEDIGDKLDIVQLLEGSIKSKNSLNCQYTLKENQKYNLKINPLKIVNFEGFWYLIAQDKNNNYTLKKYYLKNITNIKILEESFFIDSKIEELLDNSISIWFQENVEPFEVKLFVSKEITKYIKRKPLSPTQTTESVYEDGSMDIILRITHEMEIIPLVKYWIPYIKVISPVSIHNKILKDLHNYNNWD